MPTFLSDFSRRVRKGKRLQDAFNDDGDDPDAPLDASGSPSASISTPTPVTTPSKNRTPFQASDSSASRISLPSTPSTSREDLIDRGGDRYVFY